MGAPVLDTMALHVVATLSLSAWALMGQLQAAAEAGRHLWPLKMSVSVAFY